MDKYTISGSYKIGGGDYRESGLNARELGVAIQAIAEAGEVDLLTITISMSDQE